MKVSRVVRLAVGADLPLIYEWLKHELRDGIGFINNWTLIQEACSEQKMTVFVTDDGPVGFIIGGISYGTILQTKSIYQRQGIGRALVKHAIAEEEAKNNAVVVLQCQPQSSVEFWLAMGFQPHRAGSYSDSIYMHRLSQKNHAHVKGDDLSVATINVYPEAIWYTKGKKPDRVHYALVGYDQKKQTLHLAHRVSVASEKALGNLVVEIVWGGLDIYRGKVNDLGAEAIGFKTTPNCCGWYLDTIMINP